MKHLPTSDNDKFHGPYVKKVKPLFLRILFAHISLCQLSTASALDLAPLSQTSRTLDQWDKSSEWRQFAGAHRTVETFDPRVDRRINPPNLSLPIESSAMLGTAAASTTTAANNNNPSSSTPSTQPVQQPPSHGITPPPHFQTFTSQRASPPGVMDHRLGGGTTATRSVPTTPLGLSNHIGSNGILSGQLLKGPSTPDANGRLSTPGSYGLDGATAAAAANNQVDLQASLSRMPANTFDNANNNALAFGSVQNDLDDPLQVSVLSFLFLLGIPLMMSCKKKKKSWCSGFRLRFERGSRQRSLFVLFVRP
jgi:hypothetical protein